MAKFIVDETQRKNAQNTIKEMTTLQAAVGWIPVAGWLAAGAYQAAKNEAQDYLDDLDALEAFNEQLNEQNAVLVESKNDIFAYEQKIKDLNDSKTEHEDYLDDYRQMIAGEGDSDNTLLLQDQLNKENITAAENDLSAYKDSSALELDSLIRSGFSEYTSQRNEKALANIYASATGSVLGTYSSAAKRTMASIAALVGKDMKFDVSGATSLAEGGSGAGSFAKMMISSRATIRNNINKLQLDIDAANLTYLSFREQAEDSAKDSESFLEDYDSTLENYQSSLDAARENLEFTQKAIDEIMADAMEIYKDVQEYEKGSNKTVFVE